MAAGRPEGWRGRTRWGLFAALPALPALLVIGPFVYGMVETATTEDYPLGGGPEEVSCEEALEFGGARLPEGASDAECAVQVWLDTHYSAEFRMPRGGVRDWLADTYPQAPAPGPETGSCLDDADYCSQLDVTGLPGVDAHYVNVDVTYVNAETAWVRYSAFTV
ncbi:hypothetical protein [Streptomyces sp. NPDC018693]|uniref:hypothetical protein n=1 Tax=unclassified Streptomyces TaxID=2593676 RepID=UPI0037994D96